MKKSNLRAWQVLFLFVAFLVFGFMESKTAPKENKMLISPLPISAKSSTPLPPATFTPTPIIPTSTPTPAPTPNYGFCLRVPVLLYHHVRPQAEAVLRKQSSLNVDPGFFDLQMKYLTEHGYNTISADVLINALKTHSSVPTKSILITVDDGYRDFFTNAFSIIQKYGIKVNLLIATGLIGGEDNMSWDQISQIKGSGLAYFVDHTWSHYAIGRGSQDKIQYEIQTGKQQLEEHTGQSVNIFGYPYGSFNNNAISTLQSDGFLGAFSTIGGFLQCDSFIMTLHRNHVGNAPLSSYGL